ncbi:MAG TPA: DUF547 domain-containing protein [Burkholderiales bacterium]|nr:DUF547 domain-containing protein [Burkholderiales bacterium]
MNQTPPVARPQGQSFQSICRFSRRLCIFASGVLLLFLHTLPARAFDHGHAQWDALTRKHVAWIADGHASRVDYLGFTAERASLEAYLASLSAVSQSEYDDWTRAQKLAFLINAYNAFTVELILTRYPDLKSIRDLGSVLRSPWKRRFFTLLGQERSLDDIEHGMIRAPGAFDEPRIHMAVNCASIGCPALRPEAFVAQRLDAQLEDSVVRFLSDRSRNRVRDGSLQVSKIFDWYGADFRSQAGSVEKWLSRYAQQLADDAAERLAVREARLPVRFLEYDWTLNDLKR